MCHSHIKHTHHPPHNHIYRVLMAEVRHTIKLFFVCSFMQTVSKYSGVSHYCTSKFICSASFQVNVSACVICIESFQLDAQTFIYLRRFWRLPLANGLSLYYIRKPLASALKASQHLSAVRGTGGRHEDIGCVGIFGPKWKQNSAIFWHFRKENNSFWFRTHIQVSIFASGSFPHPFTYPLIFHCFGSGMIGFFVKLFFGFIANENVAYARIVPMEQITTT